MKCADVSDDVTAQCLTSIVLLENSTISSVLDEFLSARTVRLLFSQNTVQGFNVFEVIL